MGFVDLDHGGKSRRTSRTAGGTGSLSTDVNPSLRCDRDDNAVAGGRFHTGREEVAICFFWYAMRASLRTGLNPSVVDIQTKWSSQRTSSVHLSALKQVDKPQLNIWDEAKR